MIQTASIVLKNDLSEIEILIERVESFSETHGIPQSISLKVAMILEELFTNTVSYGFSDNVEHEISVTLKVDADSLSVAYEDDGIPYNPFERDDPDLDASVEDRQVGGLGVYLTKVIMDYVKYYRVGDKNKILMVKRYAS